MVSFRPAADSELDIDGGLHRIGGHPAAPGMPYGQEGRQTVVYQLLAGGRCPGLNVSRPRFRVAAPVPLAGHFSSFAELLARSLSHRVLLAPQRHFQLLRQNQHLICAVLMSWTSGPGWMRVTLESVRNRQTRCVKALAGRSGLLKPITITSSPGARPGLVLLRPAGCAQHRSMADRDTRGM